jgi:hypothetical protein
MNKNEAMEVCKAEMVKRGEKVGGAYVYPDRDHVYVRSLSSGGPGTYGAANVFIQAVRNGEGGANWVFTINNREFAPELPCGGGGGVCFQHMQPINLCVVE